MNFKLSIIIWFLGIFFCFAQTDSTKVAFVAYWSKGDSYDYVVTKIKKSWTGGELANTDSSTYFANFSVIDSTETEYKIRWKYKSNFTNLPVEFSSMLNNNSVFLEFIYKTNEVGEFLEVENWKEISEIMKLSFNSAIEKVKLEKPDIDLARLNKAMDPFLSIYASKEGIESLVLKELQYFHFPLGIEFETSHPIIYEEEFENLIGENPLRGDAIISFDHLDQENGFCIFNHDVTLNSEDAKSMVISLFEKMGMKDQKMEDFIDKSKFDVVDKNYYEYFYFPGLPYYIETDRTVELIANESKNKMQEKIRIELILEDE